jgi:hypothetical protein
MRLKITQNFEKFNFEKRAEASKKAKPLKREGIWHS